MMTRHWSELDGLRGYLALAVVTLHFGLSAYLTRALGLWPLALNLSVDVFFLLSGFVLTHSLRRPIPWRQFALKRVLRLLPVYYVTLALVLPISALTPGNFLLNLLVATPWFGSDPLNFPAWSICWELYLPLLAYALPVRISDRLVRRLLLVSLIALGWCDVQAVSADVFYFPRAVLGLLAGHLLYRARLKNSWRFELAALPVLVTILAAGALPWLAFALPWLTALALIARKTGTSVFAHPISNAVGAISYTVYLVHVPVLRLMQYFWPSSVDQNPLAKILGITAAIALAAGITRLIERPAIRRSAALFKPAPPATAPG